MKGKKGAVRELSELSRTVELMLLELVAVC